MGSTGWCLFDLVILYWTFASFLGRVCVVDFAIIRLYMACNESAAFIVNLETVVLKVCLRWVSGLVDIDCNSTFGAVFIDNI